MSNSIAGNVGIKISADGSQLRAELLASRKAVEANAAAMQSAASRIQSSANAMTAYGMSAKQTAAAMRGVPAQITDIVTSLQGGQRPMTVLLQQGGQLKDMFGGIVPAARALGTTVAGMVNPFTIGAAAAGGLALAYYKGTVESDALTKSLITTGNQAGVTAGQLQLIAQSIGKTTPGVNTSDAMAGLTQMVQAGVVGAQALERYTTAATRLAAVGGQSIEETAKAFAALAQDPVRASSKLNESLNYLTSSVYAQIYALQQQGDTIGAARLAMNTYANASNEMRRNLEGNLGYVERGWNAVKQAADDAWSAMKHAVSDWGRQKSAEEQLSALPNQMASLQEKLRASANLDPSAKKRLQDELAAAQKQQGYLQETVRMQLRAAAGAEDRKVAEQATEKWLSQGTALMDKQQRMQQEITNATNWARDSHRKDAELQQRIADIQAKYADKAKSYVADLNKARRELEAQQQLLAQLNGLSGSFAQDWERLTALYKAGKLSVQQLEGAQANLLAQQPAMRQMQQAMEAQARAAEQQQRALERAAQATAELKSRTAQANGNNKLAEEMALQAELIRAQRAGANVVDINARRQSGQTQIAYNEILRQQQAIYDTLNTKQEALSAVQESGAISGLQYSAQEHAARLQSAADLQAIVQQMEVLATVSGNADMARAAAASAAALQRLRAQLSETGAAARDVLDNNLTSAFTSFISGTENARTAFAKMTAGILQDLASIAMRKALSGAFSTGGGWIGAILDGVSGARASGGPVSGGSTYLVGEQGPELFVPGASGTIVSNNALRSSGGSAPQINITVNSDGSVQTGGGQGNPEAVAMAYRIAKNAALEVIASQKRPGGMLAA